jgi:hypothetical protein
MVSSTLYGYAVLSLCRDGTAADSLHSQVQAYEPTCGMAKTRVRRDASAGARAAGHKRRGPDRQPRPAIVPPGTRVPQDNHQQRQQNERRHVKPEGREKSHGRVVHASVSNATGAPGRACPALTSHPPKAQKNGGGLGQGGAVADTRIPHCHALHESPLTRMRTHQICRQSCWAKRVETGTGAVNRATSSAGPASGLWRGFTLGQRTRNAALRPPKPTAPGNPSNRDRSRTGGTPRSG